MPATDNVDALWASFDLISSELVKAKRAHREGRGSEDDVSWLRAELLSIGTDLEHLGEMPDLTEPGED
jgi:hypothetical protein